MRKEKINVHLEEYSVKFYLYFVSISNTMMVLSHSGKLMRKSSGGERAWFLEEESEPRNKRIFLAGENPRADALACSNALPSQSMLKILYHQPVLSR
jgi:hypothetical protein